MKKKYILKNKKTIDSFFIKGNKKVKKIYFKELIFLIQKNEIDHFRFGFFLSKKKFKKNYLKNKFIRIIKKEFNILLNNIIKLNLYNNSYYYDIIILKNRKLSLNENLKETKKRVISEIILFNKKLLSKNFL
ncbi:ribonuclease P protein component [Mycoplasma sp. SG1]|uniref:ribonuclease P protein component n=1 Tax=Mycoplasma sp. SG1 TaxID=2810348 RepID=UPI003A4C6A84